MKRLFTLLAVIALTTSLAATAAESKLQNFVDSKLSPITEKEKAFNEKMEAQQKANEAKQAELKKQQEARQAAREKQMQEAQARRQATKDAIQAEKDYWKSLTK